MGNRTQTVCAYLSLATPVLLLPYRCSSESVSEPEGGRGSRQQGALRARRHPSIHSLHAGAHQLSIVTLTHCDTVTQPFHGPQRPIHMAKEACVCVCVCVCVFVCNTYIYIPHLSLRSLTDSSCSSADLFVYVIMYVYVLMCVCARY
jgi:hypothetical protein